MTLFDLFTQNLLSPPILFFALGILAGIIRSDLEIPESISRYLSLYLMMAIGFKGGVAIANTDQFTPQVWGTMAAGVGIGLLQPFLAYGLLRLTSHIDKATAAAIAAHYGSISMVTFVTATSFLNTNGVVYAGYIVAVLALMEAPAIVSGLFIAHRTSPETQHPDKDKRLSRDILTNGSILLLSGSFLIGWITGEPGMEKVEAFLVSPFQGVLCLFLLDMGLLVARNLQHLRDFTLSLVMFGLYMPLIGGLAGLATSYALGLDVGTGMLFTVLCASASYIAVPAAMRLALPEARIAIYLPMSLALTFPFNISLGIPLYYAAATRFLS